MIEIKLTMCGGRVLLRLASLTFFLYCTSTQASAG